MEKLILTQTSINIGRIDNVNNALLKDHCLKFKNTPLNTRGEDPTDTFYEDSNIPMNKEIEKIINIINNNYNNKLQLKEFWAHIHEHNQSTNLHHHALIDNLKESPTLSAVYYVSVPKESGVIVFEYNVNQFKKKRYWIKPEVGLFIVFPSTLEHFVTRNKSQEERISISFNWSNNDTNNS